MKKTFLVTGGSGFIGSAVVNMLLSNNYLVISLDNNFRKKKYNKKKNKNLKEITTDIRDFNKINKYFKKVDAVIHLAYINGTNYFYDIPDLVLDVAVKGMINTIESCKKHKVKEFYLASSSEVYQNPNKFPTDENVPLVIPDPHNARFSYGAGKIISEMMLLHSNYFKKSIIFRPHNIYGPDMGFNHVVPELILKAHKAKKNIQIQGSGLHTRAFCYIDDFVNGVNFLIDKGINNNIYNIGTSEEVSILNLTKKIIELSNKKLIIKKSKSNLGDTSRRCPDLKKIYKIGYRPKVKLNLGLKKTYQWYLRNIIENDL